jgi:hypothetical protein
MKAHDLSRFGLIEPNVKIHCEEANRAAGSPDNARAGSMGFARTIVNDQHYVLSRIKQLLGDLAGWRSWRLTEVTIHYSATVKRI